jgi:predicted nucleic acid-binding protein
MAEAFVDVNILIRLLTGDDPQKQHDCLRLFKEVENGGLTLYTPVTTIADAVYVLTSSRHYGLPRAQGALSAPVGRHRVTLAAVRGAVKPLLRGGCAKFLSGSGGATSGRVR